MNIQPKAYLNDAVVDIKDAQLSIASSATLYGLSVYTVLPLTPTSEGLLVFRLPDHYERLMNSAKIIGIDTFTYTYEQFQTAVKEVVAANTITEQSFIRATIHVTELVPGTRSRGLVTTLSIFIYEAKPIIPQNGARLKTSVWRRIPDYAIPSRAKVNGAYINSVLGKQDALDSGYDDCIFLDIAGHVCELSAANIFIVRNGTLITPSVESDILEGITRKTVIELAQELKIPVQQRGIDLTELYIADEVFACGTSAFIAPVIEIDTRIIADGKPGKITTLLREKYLELLKAQSNLNIFIP